MVAVRHALSIRSPYWPIAVLADRRIGRSPYWPIAVLADRRIGRSPYWLIAVSANKSIGRYGGRRLQVPCLGTKRGKILWNSWSLISRSNLLVSWLESLSVGMAWVLNAMM